MLCDITASEVKQVTSRHTKLSLHDEAPLWSHTALGSFHDLPPTWNDRFVGKQYSNQSGNQFFDLKTLNLDFITISYVCNWNAEYKAYVRNQTDGLKMKQESKTWKTQTKPEVTNENQPNAREKYPVSINLLKSLRRFYIVIFQYPTNIKYYHSSTILSIIQ